MIREFLKRKIIELNEKNKWKKIESEGIINKPQICNLHIKLKGWEGSFDSELMFRRATEKYNLLKEYYSGLFEVYKINDDISRLVGGSNKRLHTFEGTIDITDHNLYISSPKEGLNYSGIINLDPHLRGYIGHIKDNPIYTLEGLYDSLFTKEEIYSKEPNKKISPTEKIDRKINALEKELWQHRSCIIDTTTCINKKTKVKVLENQYKRLISNQSWYSDDHRNKLLSA